MLPKQQRIITLQLLFRALFNDKSGTGDDLTQWYFILFYFIHPQIVVGQFQHLFILFFWSANKICNLELRGKGSREQGALERGESKVERGQGKRG